MNQAFLPEDFLFSMRQARFICQRDGMNCEQSQEITCQEK